MTAASLSFTGPHFLSGADVPVGGCSWTADVQVYPYVFCGELAGYWMRSNLNGLVFPTCAAHAAWARTQRPQWIEEISSQPLKPRRSTVTVPDPLSPDCEQRKHTACTGDAWDLLKDEPAPCTCHCHGVRSRS